MKSTISRSVLNLLMLITSFSMTIVFYFVAIDFGCYEEPLGWLWRLIQVFAPISVFFVLTAVCIKLAAHIRDKETAEVHDLRPLEAQLVPTFVGMFVISFELAEMDMGLAIWALVMLFGFWSIFSRVSYYNPLLSLMGYRFYEAKVTCGDDVYIVIITRRRDLKKGLKLDDLRRVNNYTYMEV